MAVGLGWGGFCVFVCPGGGCGGGRSLTGPPPPALGCCAWDAGPKSRNCRWTPMCGGAVGDGVGLRALLPRVPPILGALESRKPVLPTLL